MTICFEILTCAPLISSSHLIQGYTASEVGTVSLNSLRINHYMLHTWGKMISYRMAFWTIRNVSLIYTLKLVQRRKRAKRTESYFDESMKTCGCCSSTGLQHFLRYCIFLMSSLSEACPIAVLFIRVVTNNDQSMGSDGSRLWGLRTRNAFRICVCNPSFCSTNEPEFQLTNSNIAEPYVSCFAHNTCRPNCLRSEHHAMKAYCEVEV
jgi:hypothetical protein